MYEYIHTRETRLCSHTAGKKRHETTQASQLASTQGFVFVFSCYVGYSVDTGKRGPVVGARVGLSKITPRFLRLQQG